MIINKYDQSLQYIPFSNSLHYLASSLLSNRRFIFLVGFVSFILFFVALLLLAAAVGVPPKSLLIITETLTLVE